MERYDENYLTEFGGIGAHGFFGRNIYYRRNSDFLENKKRFIEERNNSDVYYCAFNYKTAESKPSEDTELLGDLYLDFDVDGINDPSNYEKLLSEIKYVLNYLKHCFNTAFESFKIYFSGSKGFHLIIPYRLINAKPNVDLNKDYLDFARGMAWLVNGETKEALQKTCIDLKIYDRRRLFRIPNSINKKSGLYKVRVSVEQLYEYDYTKLKEWASAPKEDPEITVSPNPAAIRSYLSIIKAGKRCLEQRDGTIETRSKNANRIISTKKREDFPPCVLKLMSEGANTGQRNHAAFALASSYLQNGYSLEEVMETIAQWNEDKNEDKLPLAEIINTVKSANREVRTGMFVGCGKYKDLGYCEQENCKIMKAKEKEKPEWKKQEKKRTSPIATNYLKKKSLKKNSSIGKPFLMK